MRLHPNAKLTPKTRRLLVDRVRRLGWPVARAAREAGVSRQTAYKWLNRFEEGGESALADGSCRPRRIPVRTPQRTIRRMERLRRRKKPAWEIAQELGVPVSTVSKHLQALGLGRIWRLEEAEDPPRRYEHRAPGDLLHIDAKKLARIEAIGHRIHGDRSRRRYGAGWEVAFVASDRRGGGWLSRRLDLRPRLAAGAPRAATTPQPVEQRQPDEQDEDQQADQGVETHSSLSSPVA